MDPWGGRQTEPVTLHRYLYAGNNPVMMIDPSGEFFSLGSLSAGLNIRSILSEMQATVGFALMEQAQHGEMAGLQSLAKGAVFTAGGYVAYRMIRLAIPKLLAKNKTSSASRNVFKTPDEAEDFFHKVYGGVRGERFKVKITIGPYSVVNTTRIVDIKNDLKIYEIKTGYQRYSKDIKWQILKDAALKKRQGYDPVWIFAKSAHKNKAGADQRVYDLLERYGINYSVVDK